MAENIKYGKHPVKIIKKISALYSTDIDFEFGEYRYVPQSFLDDRRIFRKKSRVFSEDNFLTHFENIPAGFEIALQSRVYIPNKKYEYLHIPMIDFVGDDLDGIIGIMKKTLIKLGQYEFFIYKTGRSFHGYSTRLLKHEEWINFMGLLLLLNLPNQTPIVDSRWIGHRIQKGYGALRLSCNSNRYLQYPQLEKHIIL